VGISIVRLVRSRAIRHATRVAACLVLAAMSVQMAPPVAVAKAPTAKTATTGNAPRVEQSKPVPAAKTRPHQPPTEVPSLRTAYTDVFDNHDGTFTASVSPDPINYQPSAGAAWAPIDLSLAPVSGGNGRLRAGKTPVPVEVGAADDAAGFVSADTGQGTISLRLAPGAKPGHSGGKPTAGTRHADLSGLLPGVDLRVIPGADGFRLFLTLASDPTTPSFTFELDSPGLTPALQANGSIAFTDKTGKLVATMPQPYATDSTVDAHSGGGRFTNLVSYALSKSGGKTLLTVKVDPSWLASAAYPVYVDPSVSTGVSGDTFISRAYQSENFNTYATPDSPYYHEMWLGMDPGNSDNVNYDLLKFNLPTGVAGATIESATLSIFPYWQYQQYAAVTTWVDTAHTPSTRTTPTATGRPRPTPCPARPSPPHTMPPIGRQASPTPRTASPSTPAPPTGLAGATGPGSPGAPRREPTRRAPTSSIWTLRVVRP
jgi:hypothetical protein